MSRLTPLQEDEMDAEQRQLIDVLRSSALARNAAAQQAGSGPPQRGPAEGWLRSPLLGERIWQLILTINRGETSLSRDLAEFVILKTVRRWEAQFPFREHARAAAEVGLSPEVIEAIRRGQPIPYTDHLQPVVSDLIEEYFAANRVSDSTYARARDALGERGVMDLIAIVGVYGLVCMITNVFDSYVPDGGPKPLPDSS